jgi:hypothetical protein
VIGVSTDPYGDSRPQGLGIVRGLESGDLKRHEMRDPELGWFGWPRWIGSGRVAASWKGPPFRPPLLLALESGGLRALKPAPLPRQEPFGEWSPNGRLIATEPVELVDCPEGTITGLCWRSSGAVYVARADGTGRRRAGSGHLGGWTPDGRLLVTDDRGEEYLVLDPEAGTTAPVIDRGAVARLAGKRRAGLGRPIWSADGRYVAALAGIAWGRRSNAVGAFVVASADGTPIRLVSSPYIISTLAWSPTGHRLAYTTSGFPDPHELFVLDEPGGKPHRLFATADRHVDWVTWSPEGGYLLVDDEHASPRGRWLLIDAKSGRIVRRLPRLGGAPQWCCPVSSYVTLSG